MFYAAFIVCEDHARVGFVLFEENSVDVLLGKLNVALTAEVDDLFVFSCFSFSFLPSFLPSFLLSFFPFFLSFYSPAEISVPSHV